MIPAFRSRFAFEAKNPAVGYKVFKLVQTGKPVVKSQVDTSYIQTNRLTVNFSPETGCIQSVVDRLPGETLSTSTLVPVCYTDNGDTWAFNIDGFFDNLERTATVTVAVLLHPYGNIGGAFLR